MPTDEVTDEVEYLLCEGVVPGVFVSAPASEQRGYDRAIAEVVAWLRAYPTGDDAADWALDGLCDAIEAGEHKP